MSSQCTEELKDHNPGHSEASETGGAPLQTAIVDEGDLARPLARRFYENHP
jgi:hypothetical protein